jgi:long-chain acyl-CoA synthetase
MNDTLVQAFMSNVNYGKDQAFLLYKHEGEWRSVTWRQVGETVRNMSLGLLALGIEKGDRISPISNTKPEMAYCCLAIAAVGAIFAAIYHTNSPSECAHVINDAGARIAFAEDDMQLGKLKAMWNDCPTLEKIVVFGTEQAEGDPRIITMNQLMELGKNEFDKTGTSRYVERMESIHPTDVISIIYTSGTTGPPKGVMFTHAGIIRNLTEEAKYFPMTERDMGIGVLPMAHAIELMDLHWRHVYFGFPHAYAQSIQTLLEDVRETKPTFLFTTPRFYEKHYQRLTAMIDGEPAWKKKLINWSLDIGTRYQDAREKNGGYCPSAVLSVKHGIASLLCLRKIRALVDDRLRWSSSGGAPIQPKILGFFRSCDMPIYEGFGMTESQGLIALNRPGAWKVGTVGKPMDGVEVSFDEEGELLVKGWTRCAGYWNRPEATEELFRDGWLHTGDIGFIDEDGFLHITGRKKELIITSTGKNIAPLNIQNLLKTSPYISEAIIFGEGKTYLTALITLDEEKITQYAKDRGIAFSDLKTLAGDPAVVDLIQSEVEIQNQQLARIEQVKKFTILGGQFRQDRDELTPTMKVKRSVVERRYKSDIEAMYA